MHGRFRLSPRKLVKYLKRANQVERKVLGLYYLENLCIADISTILEKDPQYVSEILGGSLENLTAKISKSNSQSRKGTRLP